MRIVAWGPAVALAMVGAAACSGSVQTPGAPEGGSGEGDGGGGSLFPFTGPACTLGPPGTTQANLECGQCEEIACAGMFGCIVAACTDFFTCACKCPANDYINCEAACPLSSACQDCSLAVRTCTDLAATGKCAGPCAVLNGSGGSSSSSSSSTSSTSSGTASGSGSGSGGDSALVCTQTGSSASSGGGQGCQMQDDGTCGSTPYSIDCSCPAGTCTCTGGSVSQVAFSGCPACPTDAVARALCGLQ